MIDFESAKTWHKHFLNYIQSIVNGTAGLGFDLKTVGDETKCELGKWLIAQGADISSMPEFAHLSDKHREFHIVAALVVNEHMLESASPLESMSMADLMDVSHEVIAALDKLQAKLDAW